MERTDAETSRADYVESMELDARKEPPTSVEP